jgi:hypothetical protein
MARAEARMSIRSSRPWTGEGIVMEGEVIMEAEAIMQAEDIFGEETQV